MENRIEACFKELKMSGRKALVPFITAGDPDLAATRRLVIALAEAGADIIELGVPFSDPMADGPVIQAASERALRKGTTLAKILKLVERVRKKTEVPLLLMGYANPIYKMGLEVFAGRAKKAGVDAVLTVDLPPEEAEEYQKVLVAHGIHPIFLLAPTSSLARIQAVARLGSGFVYYVSVTGVTGAKLRDLSAIKRHLDDLRKELHTPLCVGFGITTAREAKEIAKIADGVVVGSALVQAMVKEKKTGNKVKAAVQFIQSLRKVV